VEIFWAKLALMVTWETYVLCAFHTFPRTQQFHIRSWSREECPLVRKSFSIIIQELNGLPSPSSSIIHDIQGMCVSGQASLAFFYCDFREDQKKDARGLLSSLLVQLCGQSDAYYDALFKFYEAHGQGSRYASDSELAECLKHVLELSEQVTVYIIIDALDECPTTDPRSPREQVLKLVKELVESQIPNLRICVTSRPEADVEPVLHPLALSSVSLHGENGQVQDIAEYVKFFVDTDPKMKKWREEDRKHVIEVLTRKADGM
jgi:NACHT domain